MSRDFNDFTIGECDETVAKYGLTDFETYIARDFPRFSATERLAVLQQWDAMMGNEHRPTRDLADYVSRKRRLDHVHFALVKVYR